VALEELYANRAAILNKQCSEFLQAELPQLQAKHLVLEGDPAQTIVRYAHDVGMNLIVLPTHGYGPFRRFILGSVAAKVLHDADCPVWTGVHLEEAPPVEKIHFRTVLVGVDLGEQSEKTLSWAAQFACANKARLVMVHATPSLEGRTSEYFDPDWRGHMARQANLRLSELLEQTGIKAEIAIDAGDAPHVVCGAAQQFNADLLVIGRGSAAGIFGRLRANAYSIIRQSPCPVVSV
jgi:nucleotide-binding universal stress UspA family protein